MYMSEVMTFRIPKELQAEMAAFDINWSEYLREAIRQKLVMTRREKAFKEMDEIREKYKGTGLSMSEEVKKWRKLH